MAKKKTTTAPDQDELTAEVRHRDGCPAERTEVYDARRPSGEELTIARCVDCGGSSLD